MKKAYLKTFLTFKLNSRLHDHLQEMKTECFILAMVIMGRFLVIAFKMLKKFVKMVFEVF